MLFGGIWGAVCVAEGAFLVCVSGSEDYEDGLFVGGFLNFELRCGCWCGVGRLVGWLTGRAKRWRGNGEKGVHGRDVEGRPRSRSSSSYGALISDWENQALFRRGYVESRFGSLGRGDAASIARMMNSLGVSGAWGW